MQPKAKLEFREGTINDLSQLKALALSSYGQFENQLSDEGWQSLNKILKSNDSYSDILKVSKCFVCEIEDEIVGVAYFVPSGNPTEIYDTSWSCIRMIGVNPKFRGKKISKILTKKCLDYAMLTNETTVALHTSEFMHAAIHIYEQLGFEKVKELKPNFGMRYWLYQVKVEKTVEIIKLKPFTEVDFDTFKSWINSKEELFQFAGPIFSYPIKDEELMSYINTPTFKPFKVILCATNESIGHCELNFQNGGHKLSRILIGNKELRGMKIGEVVIRKLVSMFFEDPKVTEVELNTFDWNKAAIRCYEKVGFEINPKGAETLNVDGEKWTKINMVLKR